MKFTKEQREYIIDGYPEDILEKSDIKIVLKACNTENVHIHEGTYTVELLNWGEIKSTLKCIHCFEEKYFADFDDFMAGRVKR